MITRHPDLRILRFLVAGTLLAGRRGADHRLDSAHDFLGSSRRGLADLKKRFGRRNRGPFDDFSRLLVVHTLRLRVEVWLE